MTDKNILSDRCLLTHERPGATYDIPSFLHPNAHCAGNPPQDPLLLYPLCLDCDLFHHYADRELFATLAAYMTETNATVIDQQLSLNIGCAAMRKMLERLSIGDPDARVVLPEDVGIFRELEPLLNRMADFMKEQVDESHEVAIGLCEQYETLLKLANGDLESRASTASPIELIAKLGELINRQAEAFSAVLREQKNAVQERELLKDQLHHAQKLDSIGQLAGGIAHEFNNILAAILGYAGILELRLGKDSPHLTAVHRIISASEKAASLTRGMLTFSRKQAVELQPVQLNLFITGMKEMLCSLAGENIQVAFHLHPQELILNADQGQLQQIILNLYNNARDAMPEGGCLTITTEMRTINGADDAPVGIPAGKYGVLTVADTGTGISPDDMNRIFDPFFTTKDIGKGTGLGLSVVFGIVQQHFGFITVNSTAGQGTAFSIWFPENSIESSRKSVCTLPEQEADEGGCETILVGEDNEDVRVMIVELLSGVGYQVLEAQDGAEFVLLMEKFGYTVDLLLLDVIMPRMNGYEALAAVRELYPDIPCVFLSGYSDENLKQKAHISGEFEYLPKPILPGKLLAAVRAALDARVS